MADRVSPEIAGLAVPPTLQEPVAWITSPVQWATRQSEMTRKMTREKQAEFGFTTPLYAAPPKSERGEPEEIATRVHHERTPDCCGCWIVVYNDKGLFARCNECGELRDLISRLEPG